MRQNWLSNRIFKSFDDIVDHCCYAWNTLIDQPWKIMSIARRDWAIVVAYLLWRTWRGYDWIAASGWALLAISVTSTWLLAWYILWPLPLAAIVRDRRLVGATLAVQGLFVLHQISPLLAPVK